MIAIDSSVLVDLLTGGPGADSAEVCLRQCLVAGPVVVCEVTLAEVCSALRDGAEALAVLEDMSIRYVPLETKSAVRAGEMQRRYRQRMGQERTGQGRPGQERTVPDFLIGAHALLQCDGLITRDAAFYRDFFKGLKLIVPRQDELSDPGTLGSAPRPI